MRTATVTLDAPSSGSPPVSPGVPSPPTSDPGLRAGRRFGPYELLLPLASGGMGHVWSAVRLGDFGFRRTVAIKVMREELAQDPEFRRMFLDEARAASRISHGNVVEVLDLGESEGVLFQAMALVEGDSLARLLDAARAQGRPVTGDVAARVVSDVLRGLHSAHELRGEQGEPLELVHRDVSPQNILVGLDGIAKITDFGIAKAAGVSGHASRSNPKGKLAYMPREQFFGEAIDRRCDLYAAGVILWEMLAGRRFVGPDDTFSWGAKQVHPSEIRPEANRALGDVAMRAFAAAPEDRFATAEEMADAVERVAHDSDLVLSSKTVAGWVSGYARDRILSQRHETEAQLARTAAGGTATLSAPPPRAASWRKLRLLAATVPLVPAVVWMMTRAPAPAVVASVSPSSVPSEVASAPLSPVEPPPPRVVATESAASPSVIVSAARSPRPAPRGRPPARPSAAASPPATANPKYANPYERSQQ